MSELRRALVEFITAHPQRAFVIALSGGLDSRTLLHVAALLRDEFGITLRAVHVHHGLQPDSAQWAQRCGAWCGEAGVDLDIARVQVLRIGELGMEAAARAARHAAFAERLGDDEVLLTAQHRDDQAETFLLRALRAPGFDGLAGMRPLRRFARGWMARPWLAISRDQIRAEALAAKLEWIDDPSNTDIAHDRNFLRHDILPRLLQRWPQAAAALAHAAARNADAVELAEGEVRRRLARLQRLDPALLDVRVLDEPDGIAIALIRSWLRELALPNPPPPVLTEALRQMRSARADRVPEVRWPGGVMRRYRDNLHAEHGATVADLVEQHWDTRESLRLENGLVLPALPALFDFPLRVSARCGGEKLQLHAGASRRPVRLLLQEYGVPPWQRERLPYLWHADRLLAVGDLFLDHGFADLLRGAGIAWRVESAPRWG